MAFTDDPQVPAGWRLWPVRFWLTALVLLCPLKFGLVTVTDEVPMFPGDAWEWIFGTWPPFLAPVLAGGALLLCALLLPAPRPKPGGGRTWLFPAAWVMFLLCLLPGLLRTTEWESARLVLGHWVGAAAFALAAYWAIAHDRRLGAWLLAALAAGTLLAAFDGWMQGPGGGLAAVAEEARKNGVNLPPGMLARISEGRVPGPFVYPNSLAAHLILTGPVILWAAWRTGGLFQPARISRWALAAPAAVLLGGALWLSGSRTAMLALGAGAGAAVLAVPALRQWRGRLLAGVAALVLLAAAAGTWKAVRHRQTETAAAGKTLSELALSSAGARADYARGSLKMIATAPATGVGLGEFFPNYIRLRRPGAEDTRQPHCMVLGYAAQAGILSGLAALVLLGLPLFLRRIAPVAGTGLVAAVQAGAVAWGLHALADINSEIAGSVMVFALLPLLIGNGKAEGKGQKAEGVSPQTEKRKNGRTEKQAEAGKPRPVTMILFRAVAVLLAVAALAGVWRWPGERAYAEAVRQAEKGASPEAVAESARKAARLLPESPYPWNLLGRQAWAAGNAPAAEAAFREAVARTPHRSGFWEPLAESALAGGDAATARRAAAKAREWNPASPRVQDLCRRADTAQTAP